MYILMGFIPGCIKSVDMYMFDFDVLKFRAQNDTGVFSRFHDRTVSGWA